ncbi:MAG: hypothetical protein KF681_05225 [Bdellovibrionaceae bacterium]|nr:hypothetical protein [Pseudobdellovibrionaceae bacterium]
MKRQTVPTSELSAYLPHRAPMVWIDEVTAYGPEGGEALVHLKPEGLYFSNGELRPSSLIEFMAQGQGFVGACHVRDQNVVQTPKRAFLVAVTKAEFGDAIPKVRAGDTLRVEVGPSRQLGEIHVFKGSVTTSSGDLLCSAQLKVFISFEA